MLQKVGCRNGMQSLCDIQLQTMWEALEYNYTMLCIPSFLHHLTLGIWEAATSKGTVGTILEQLESVMVLP